MVVHEVGGSRDIDGSSSGIIHLYRLQIALHLTIRLHQDTALGLQTGLDAFVVNTIDNGSQFVDGTLDTLVGRNGKHLCLQRCRETHVKLQFTFLAGLQLDDDDTIRLRGKDGTLVLHTIIYIRGGGKGGA